VNRALAFLLIVLGLTVVTRTILAGVGGGLGLLVGGLFIAAGVGRLYLARSA
jgi:hypothetical protein